MFGTGLKNERTVSYNTGARDWKYNNDYVDANDSWRHSKWLAMMRRRLVLAKRLLNPQTGVLIVTIDEHEVHHLGMLLEHVFPECARQMATTVINQKGVAQGRLARVEEYALFVFMPEAVLRTHHDDLLSPDRSKSKRFMTPRWEWLLRGGNNSRREDRPGLFYPIYVDPQRKAVIGVGETLPLDELPDLDKATDGTVAWPVRTGRTWTVQYLNQGTRARIANGEIRIVYRSPVTGAVEVEYASDEAKQRNIKTVWHRGTHDSGIYGSNMLRAIVGRNVKFDFPKSIYSVRDAVAAVVRDKPKALVIDFFAGSGTTLHAVEILNATDGGNRRCILVTNNEVSDDEARTLAAQGYHPGDHEWEQHGICRSVTWPRSKYTILGRRSDGTVLEGEYLTGKMISREAPRHFHQIGFVDAATLTTAAKKKELVALIDGVPQSLVKRESTFIVSGDYKASILFDEAAAEDWLAALEDQDHITDFYIITTRQVVFDDLKSRITELLGPILVSEEERRPMRDGFAANLEYFRLDFLDRDQVALKRRLRELLPILWLRAGAVGLRPELPQGTSDPDWLVPRHNPFAVLLDERRFGAFLEVVADRDDLTHVFLVTDSEDAFQEMATQLKTPHLIQLYRDYLENFIINRGGEA
jgi:adenine-specific DNA-methyltransferase